MARKGKAAPARNLRLSRKSQAMHTTCTARIWAVKLLRISSRHHKSPNRPPMVAIAAKTCAAANVTTRAETDRACPAAPDAMLTLMMAKPVRLPRRSRGNTPAEPCRVALPGAPGLLPRTSRIRQALGRQDCPVQSPHRLVVRVGSGGRTGGRFRPGDWIRRSGGARFASLHNHLRPVPVFGHGAGQG